MAGTLDGIWNYATMTTLERPRDLAAKATLTPAESTAAGERILELGHRLSQLENLLERDVAPSHHSANT